MAMLERFLRYVKVWTTSDENALGTTPSTARQFELARLLTQELLDMGAADAQCSEYCYVTAHIPATPGYENKPRLGFIAHIDTAEFCGENVRPRVIENYDGKRLELGNGLALDPREYRHLKKLRGRTLITTDGTTLLGADDKAGVTEIMELAEKLLSGEFPHGPVCVCFTPDEEIVGGTLRFDLDRFAADFAYTVDGGEEGEINWECFNADAARVEITGCSIHPGDAKNGMINANIVAMEFNAMLPAGERPEHTENYEGFFGLMHMDGTVGSATLDYILRDHDAAKLAEKRETMQHAAALLNEKYGADTVKLLFREQYRNMREALTGAEHLVKNAEKAAKMAGVKPIVMPIRGGTDGATLSWKGLPCPNLGTGGWCFHGPLEHITLEGMEKELEILENLVRLYAGK